MPDQNKDDQSSFRPSKDQQKTVREMVNQGSKVNTQNEKWTDYVSGANMSPLHQPLKESTAPQKDKPFDKLPLPPSPDKEK